MFEKLSFNENNEQILCEMNGKHSDMMMNIKVKDFKAEENEKNHIEYLSAVRKAQDIVDVMEDLCAKAKESQICSVPI